MSELPTPQNVSALLRDLLGRQVTVKDNRVRLSGDVLWALYSSDGGEDEAIWTWDIPSGICVGAALTMVPADQALQDVRRRAVDEMVLENFQEVANILSSVLNEGRKDSLVLREVGFDDAKKGKMSAKVKSFKTKAFYVVDIDGYGSGATELRTSAA